MPATDAVVYATAAGAGRLGVDVLEAAARTGSTADGGLVARDSTRAAGSVRGVLPVVAVCAAAGIITASTTKTGLGPQAASLLVRARRRDRRRTRPLVRLLTALFAAVALTLLGLAVPVTASFIIGWVIIGPALLDLGVPAPAVAMFVFYFAVLSEATPPTALASVAAAAVTGGRIVPTMWQTLRYALPAYLVPMAFVAAPAGTALIGAGGAGKVAYALAGRRRPRWPGSRWPRAAGCRESGRPGCRSGRWRWPPASAYCGCPRSARRSAAVLLVVSFGTVAVRRCSICTDSAIS